jgi:hypothetical protein
MAGQGQLSAAIANSHCRPFQPFANVNRRVLDVRNEQIH